MSPSIRMRSVTSSTPTPTAISWRAATLTCCSWNGVEAVNWFSLSTIFAASSAPPMIDLNPTFSCCSSEPFLISTPRPATNEVPIAVARLPARPAISPKLRLKLPLVRRRSALSLVKMKRGLTLTSMEIILMEPPQTLALLWLTR